MKSSSSRLPLKVDMLEPSSMPQRMPQRMPQKTPRLNVHPTLVVASFLPSITEWFLPFCKHSRGRRRYSYPCLLPHPTLSGRPMCWQPPPIMKLPPRIMTPPVNSHNGSAHSLHLSIVRLLTVKSQEVSPLLRREQIFSNSPPLIFFPGPPSRLTPHLIPSEPVIRHRSTTQAHDGSFQGHHPAVEGPQHREHHQEYHLD